MTGMRTLRRAVALVFASVSLAGFGGVAAAQSASGAINLSGTVAPKCLVMADAGTRFGTLVALGELSKTDGRLATDLAPRFSATGGSGLTARVVCTTANPTVSVDAIEIRSATPAAAGYTNRIDFTARVALSVAPSGIDMISNDSRTPATGPTALSGRLANNGNGNITIMADSFATPVATDRLVAGSYSGRIDIVIAPGV